MKILLNTKNKSLYNRMQQYVQHFQKNGRQSLDANIHFEPCCNSVLFDNIWQIPVPRPNSFACHIQLMTVSRTS